MKCCGRDVNGIELQVADQPFVLLRCGECDTSYWMHNDRPVSFEEVTAAMRRETAQAGAGRGRRRRRSSGT